MTSYDGNMTIYQSIESPDDAEIVIVGKNQRSLKSISGSGSVTDTSILPGRSTKVRIIFAHSLKKSASYAVLGQPGFQNIYGG